MIRNAIAERIASPKTLKQPLKKRQEVPRNFGLDLIRCVAILLVLVNHGSYMYYDHLPEFIGNNISLTGHWGVQLFFVLSGFLVGSILIRDTLLQKFDFKAVFNFWKRRWFRTLPNYYLFFGIYLALSLAVPQSFIESRFWKDAFVIDRGHDIGWFPFCLQNFLETTITFMGHSWSLTVEEWFYLLLPAALFPVILFNKIISLRKVLLVSFITLTIALMALRVAALQGIVPAYTKLAVIYNLDNLMLGVIMGWLFIYHKSEVLKRKNLLMAIAGSLFLTGFLLQNKFILTGAPDYTWDALIVPLHAVAFACSLPWFYDLKLKRHSWVSRMVTEISMVSYSMYLVHFIILVFVVDVIQIEAGVNTPIGALTLFLLFLATTILISSMNYRLFEKPMTALREKFSYT